MLKQYCPYCLPTKRRTHIHFHIAYYLNKANFFKFNLSADKLWPLVLQALAFAKIVKFEKAPDQSKLLNRSLIFFNEAKKRNIDIQAVKVLGKYRNDFRFIYNKKKYYYEGIPLFRGNVKFNMDDKVKSRALLVENNIPAPRGKVFLSAKKAIKFARQIDWPVVVKPSSGSLSQHVVCNICSEQELKQAIKIAKIYRPDFIVEKYIPGQLYRATVIGKTNVFCCERQRPNVIGNGKSTILELINQKNKQEKRGEQGQKNCTLHKISMNDILKTSLKNQGLDLSSVLPENRKIYLHHKHILSAGCDVIGMTNKMHPDNKELFLRIAMALNTDLVGIDIICSDISKSYKQQTSAVLETNSLPYIDMHQETSHGRADEAAKVVWDLIINKIYAKNF